MRVASHIHKREDTDPKAGIKKYGKVEFADDTNCKYPIHRPWYVKAAWEYIHYPNNASKYTKSEVALIKQRIMEAAERFHITLEQYH